MSQTLNENVIYIYITCFAGGAAANEFKMDHFFLKTLNYKAEIFHIYTMSIIYLMCFCRTQ